MNEIHLSIIPHTAHRYATIGDYFTREDGVEEIVASKMEKEVYSHLVLIHELVERFLCYHRNIQTPKIDEFDIRFERLRDEGKAIGEPGDDVKAPYYREHQFATVVERILCAELGISWTEYEAACDRLS